LSKKKIIATVTGILVVIIGTYVGVDNNIYNNTYNELKEGQTEISSFSKAKRLSAQVTATMDDTTFYCGCEYSVTNKSTGGGKTDLKSCEYDFRKNKKRAERIEWEHIVPASRSGKNLQCWNEGHSQCDKPGRECCAAVNEAYKYAQSDLHNLVPAIGEVNGDRSNLEFGIIQGEKREYGKCDVEINRDLDIVEPKEDIRGNIARTYLYMSETYGIPLSEEEVKQYSIWNRSDPADREEKVRNTRIRNIQGTSNSYVTKSKVYYNYGN